jgi:multisubunit Na+/H+ antiporter MnhB subunit
MMSDRPAQAPAELVIWGSTAALGIVTGTGAAFALWAQLHRSPDIGIVVAAVLALAVGLGLIGLAISNTTARLFLVVVAAALAVAFFAGAGTFATLIS